MRHQGLKRLFKHLFSTPWTVGQYFSEDAMRRIENAIKHSEQTHLGEICFVVEADLHPIHVLRGKTPRQRAIEIFSQFGIWDTESNNGVLIYLMLADRDVEIVADRGVHRHVGDEGWGSICKEMENLFKQKQFEQGVLLGINKIGGILQQHYPADSENENELPNRPIVL